MLRTAATTARLLLFLSLSCWRWSINEAFVFVDVSGSFVRVLPSDRRSSTRMTSLDRSRSRLRSSSSSSDNDEDDESSERGGGGGGMKRPFLDRLATTLFDLENRRVEASSVVDAAGRVGEPMEWSESDSLANRLSEAVATNGLGRAFKQFVADVVAGDYDEPRVTERVRAFVNDDAMTGAPVSMYSFTTCPFCRRAKDLLDERGVEYVSVELDELPGNEGNEIRAVLGKLTGRTSVPSIFVKGRFVGGCNDGSPGLVPLVERGELDAMLNSDDRA